MSAGPGTKRRLERTTPHQQEAVVLWFCSEVLEYALLPVLLHEIPVIDETVTDGIVYAVAVASARCEGFVSDEKVEILDTPFAG